MLGSLYEHLMPLLDGSLQLEEILAQLSPRFTHSEVYLTLISLQSRGYLCESISTITVAEAAFWAELDVDPEKAVRLIRSSRVALQVVSSNVNNAVIATLKRALQAAGLVLIENTKKADLVLVMCDHYLHPELDVINENFHRNGQNWLLMRPFGRELWLGPFFNPEHSGCYECLGRLLRRHRKVEIFSSMFRDNCNQIPPPIAIAPGGAALISELAALEACRILAGAAPVSAGQVISFNLANYSSRRHALVVDPHCGVCGELPDFEFQPLVLNSCEVRFDQDGGHRHVSAQQTLDRFDALVSPITGIVSELQTVNSNLPSVHVVVAGRNSAQQIKDLDDLRRNLRSSASGKGASALQARVSALGEALERFSGEIHPGVLREPGSFNSMQTKYGDAVIHPNAVMRYSNLQYEERLALNARASRFNQVPKPLDPNLEIDWTPIWSLSRQRCCYLPTQLLMMGSLSNSLKAVEPVEPWIAMGCSNGNAAGNTLEEAVLQGFLELVERDATAIWWYNRLNLQGINLSIINDTWTTQLIEEYHSIGREVWALDLTFDLGITCVVALSRVVEGDAERIIMGLGCHLDPYIAIQRSLAEMNQMLGIADTELDGENEEIEDHETTNWLNTATVANQPYLLPATSKPLKSIEGLKDESSGDLLLDIQYCCRCVEEKGMEVLVLNQTRAIVGLPVVKVVVPGLRHFWARHAPGRLYDIPLQLGLITSALLEEELNPIPIFF